jgi:DNA-binding GntR family transcriptional regulator
LLDLIEQLRQVAARYISMVVHKDDRGYREEVQAEHEAILEALVRHDGDLASRLVYQHLDNNAEHIAKLVERVKCPD